MTQKKRGIGAAEYLAFACSAVPNIAASYLLSGFVTVYFTDIALVSAGIIGTVILVMRVTDGFSDLLMGRIIDCTGTRWGKARPWIFAGTVGISVTLLLIFHVPAQWTTAGKVGYFAVVYFLLMVVFVTMEGISATTMIAYMTNDPVKRNALGASNMAGTYIGGIIALTVTAGLLSAWGYDQGAYDRTMVIYAVLILAAGLFAFFRLKEDPDIVPERKKEDKVPVALALRSILKNKYYLYAVAAGLLINLINGINTGLGVYYCRDLFGNAGLYSLVTIATLLPILIGMPFAVKIANRIGRYKTLAFGRLGYLIFVAVASVGIMMKNVPVYFAGMAMAGLFGASFGACFTATVADTCDYSEYISGVKATGMLLSATSFCNKVGLGLGSAVTGLLLVLARYDGSLETQSAYTVRVEQLSVAIIPVVLTAIVTLCLFRCNIDGKMPEVRKALREKGEGGNETTVY